MAKILYTHKITEKLADLKELEKYNGLKRHWSERCHLLIKGIGGHIGGDCQPSSSGTTWATSGPLSASDGGKVHRVAGRTKPLDATRRHGSRSFPTEPAAPGSLPAYVGDTSRGRRRSIPRRNAPSTPPSSRSFQGLPARPPVRPRFPLARLFWLKARPSSASTAVNNARIHSGF